MLALGLMLSGTYCAKNYAGIIDLGLPLCSICLVPAFRNSQNVPAVRASYTYQTTLQSMIGGLLLQDRGIMRKWTSGNLLSKITAWAGTGLMDMQYLLKSIAI